MYVFPPTGGKHGNRLYGSRIRQGKAPAFLYFERGEEDGMLR